MKTQVITIYEYHRAPREKRPVAMFRGETVLDVYLDQQYLDRYVVVTTRHSFTARRGSITLELPNG